ASVSVSLTAAGTASAFTQNAGTVSGNVLVDGAGAGFTQSAGGVVSGTLSLSNGATANVAGTVSGATSVQGGSELTQTAGTLAAVELMDGARFVQTGGSAGAVSSWNCGVDVAGTVDSLTLHAVESDKGATVSGTVTGATTLTDGSTLTQTAGTLNSVVVSESNFIQNGGSAASVSVSGESSTATLGGAVKNLSISAGAATLAADQTFETLAISGGAIDAGTHDVTVASAIADGAGTIFAKNISLNGLSGTTTLRATETLTLNGTTSTDGTVMAGTLLAVSGDATLSGIVVAGATTVSGALTLEANGNVGALNVAATGALRLGERVSADASGATVAGELALGEGSTLNVTGTDAVAVKSLTMNGGWLHARGDVTVASAIADGAGSVLGNNVTLNGASVAAGKTLSAVAYDTLTLAGETTGLLVSADERLVVTGTATLSDVYVGHYSAGTAGTTEISGTLTLIASDAAEAEHVIGATTLKSGGTLNVNTDATADVVFAADATGATVNVSGATLTGDVTLSGATNVLTLTNANVAGTLTATGGLLHLFETNTAGAVAISDGATVVMEEGATLTATGAFVQDADSRFVGDVEVENGPATIAGTVVGFVSLTDVAADTNSTLRADVTGGLSLDASTLTMEGGAVAGTTTLSNASALTQEGGALGDVFVTDSTFTQTGGSAQSVSIRRTEGATGVPAASTIAGRADEVVVSGDGLGLAFTGHGETRRLLIQGDGATLTMDGGYIEALHVADGATATISDGVVDKIGILAGSDDVAATVVLAKAETELASLSLMGAGAKLDAGTNALTVASAIADGAGKIKGGDVTLNGLSGTTAVTAMGTLTLNGATRTSGDVVANGKLVISSGAEATLSGHVGAGEARIDGALTLTGTDWEQSDRLGALISVGENGAFVVDYIAASTIRVDSASTISLKNGAWLSAALSFKTKTLELSGGAKLYNAFRNEDQTLEVVEKIEDGDGTIEGGTVTLRGGVSGNVNVSAMKDLNLGGETTTTGTLSAKTITVLSAASLTADFSKIAVEETLAVNADATATLTIDAESAVVNKLTADGAVTLSGGNAFSLGNLRGAGTVEKTGAGALTLGASADFSGTLKISEGAATLSSGATFGGSLGFFSENETLTAGDGATIAGTLTLGSGTTLELGGRDAKATVSVGALAAGGSSAQTFSVRAQSASAGAATIVHDVYSASEYDVLRVGPGADLSFATALLRAGAELDVSALAGAPDGVTLTLVEGDVARGYGALQLADELALANFALSPDGTTASVGLGANALAAGVFPLETTADQRSVAQAATRAGTASGYGAALNALTNPHDTLAALDALGAGHAAAMMPAQIDGAWNRLRSVMNAAGTGARLGAETELAAWAQYAGSWTDVDSSRERASWTRRMHGAHAGVERAFASGWTAGAALGFEDSEQKTGGAKIGDDALSASLYARRTQDAFTQTAALSFARHDYETRRTVAFPGYAARTRGDTLGFTAALSYEASYAFAVADWAKLSPVASLSAAWNTIEGWTESGADAALRCGDQDALTWLAGVGGRADFEFANPFSAEAKARAGAYALFTAEFGERSCGVDAEFADTGAGFTARYDDPSRYALQLGVTASLPLSGNTSLFGGVSTELREDETNLNANLGVRFAW
ncbi:MAG: autotransporter domain-containing protein, partial [Candidatus Spyradosoma sp.]